MNSRRAALRLLLIWALALEGCWAGTPLTAHLINDSGSRLFVQWVNPLNGDLLDLHQPDDPSKPGSITRYNSFTGDELVVNEAGADCGRGEVCRQAYLSTPGPKEKDYESDSDDDDQEEFFVIDSWFQIEHVTDPAEIRELFRIFGDKNQKRQIRAGNNKNSHSLATNLHIRNNSQDIFVDIYFIHNDDDSVHKLTAKPLLPSRVDPQKAAASFDTYVGNRFELVETYGCEEDECRRVRVVVPPPNKEGLDPGVLIEDNFKVTIYGGEGEETEEEEMVKEQEEPRNTDEYWDMQKGSDKNEPTPGEESVPMPEILRDKMRLINPQPPILPKTAQSNGGKNNPVATTLHIRNDSKEIFLNIFFVNNEDDSLVKVTNHPLLPWKVDPQKAVVSYNTFVGDRFELVEYYGCEGKDCRRVRIVVPPRKPEGPDPAVLIEEKFKVTVMSDKEEAILTGSREGETTVLDPKSREFNNPHRPLTTPKDDTTDNDATTTEEDVSDSSNNTPTGQDYAEAPDYTEATWKDSNLQKTKEARNIIPLGEHENKRSAETATKTLKKPEVFRPPPLDALTHPRLQDRYRRKAMQSNVQSTPAIINFSGVPVDVYLMSPFVDPANFQSEPTNFKSKLNDQGPVPNAIKFDFVTLVYQEFEVRETGECDEPGTAEFEAEEVTNRRSPPVCRRVRFRVGDKAPTVTINDQFQAVTETGAIISSPKRESIVSLNLLQDQQQDAAKPFSVRVFDHCKQESKLEFVGQEKSTENSLLLLESIRECVEQILGDKIDASAKELQAMRILRRHFAPILEDYTCKDTNLDTSEPIEVREWSPSRDEPARNVSILMDQSTAKIHVIDDFVSDDECAFVERTRMGQYQYAMVSDEATGGVKVSESRNAQQAPLKVPWDKEHKGQKLAKVGRRLYDYASHIFQQNISEAGQEQPTLIRYEGKGFHVPHPEQYMAHCDGRCDGRNYVSGMRVATMILYCKVADAGGHTNFRHSNIHIKPKKGAALFFSYVDSDLRRIDDGMTQHSGCPVFMGEKLIITQWIRTGVDDDQNKWYFFDDDGNKMTNEQYHRVMQNSFSSAVGGV